MKNEKFKLEMDPLLGFRLLSDHHSSADIDSDKIDGKRGITIDAKVGGKARGAMTAKIGNKLGVKPVSPLSPKVGDKNPDRFLLIGAKTGQKNG
jgi:hypothetical protein